MKPIFLTVSVEQELPKETNERYGVIIDGSDCIDSAVFTRLHTWVGIGSASVTHWLKPITSLSELPEEWKKEIREMAGKSFDKGAIIYHRDDNPQEYTKSKQEHINGLLK